MPKSPDEPNVLRILRFFRRRGIWILLCVIVSTAVAFAYSQTQPKRYSASASVVFSSDQLSPAIAGLPALSAEGNALLRQSNNLELLYLGGAANKTAKIVGAGLTGHEISENVSIGGEPESSVANISATSDSPALAAKIANVYAAQSVKVQEKANRGYFSSALKIVHRQLDELSSEQREGTTGLTLENRAQSLELLAALQPSSVHVAQPAFVPTAPSSPKTARNMAVGALLGLVLGFALALALERLDPRVHGGDELRAIYESALLGTVARSSTLAQFLRSGGRQPALLTPGDIESFQLIRARLRSFSPGEIRSVLITSAASREGKTTVAVNLAAAAARAGSHVLLLDVNLRRSDLAESFRTESDRALPTILRSRLRVANAAQPMWPDSVTPDGRAVRGPDVLPSDPIGSINPAAVLESSAMASLLEDAKTTYDLVVIDAPGLNFASDAFPLIPQVDAVIIVGYLGKARRDDAERLNQALTGAAAPIAGVVVNGARSSQTGACLESNDGLANPTDELQMANRSSLAV